MAVIATFFGYRYANRSRSYSGVDSARVRWEYNMQTRTLKFEQTKAGKWKMADYEGADCESEEPNDAPWEMCRTGDWWKFIPACEKVVFGKGIISIGVGTCEEFEQLSHVEMPETAKVVTY